VTCVGIMASGVNVASGPCTDVLREPFDNLAAWTGLISATVDASGRTGTCLKLATGSGAAKYSFVSNKSDTVTVGFAFRTDLVGGQARIFELRGDAGVTLHGTLYVEATNGLTWYRSNSAGAALAASAAGLIAVNTWYYLEAQIKLSDTVGTVDVRLNGVSVMSGSGLDTRNAGTDPTFDMLSLTNVAGPSPNSRYDDLYISAGSGCAFKGDQTIVRTGPVILNDPCENLSAWVTVTGSPAITASGHTGNAFSLPSGASIAYDIPSALQTNTLTFGAWVRWPTLSGSLTAYIQWRSDAGATLHGSVEFDSGGFVDFRRGDGTVIGSTASGTGIVVNTWYFIEASVKVADSGGSCVVKRDGVTILSVTGDTKNGGTKNVLDRVLIGNTSLWDDIYVRNDATFGPV
jgi:hypothetical protein